MDYIQTGRVIGAASVEKTMGRSYFRHLILASTAFAAVVLMAPDAYAVCTTLTITGATSVSALATACPTVTFDGGTLRVTASGSATQAFDLTTGVTNTINQLNNSYSFSGAFSDLTTNGSISITNTSSSPYSGGITFSAANSYTGSTAIGANATLLLTGLGAIATSSAVTDNGTFDVSNAGGTIQNLTGSGTVNLGSQALTVNDSGSAKTFTGTITGTNGSLTIFSGTQELSTGASTYSGGTTIDASAQLTLKGGATISNSVVSGAGALVLGADSTVGALNGSGAVTLAAHTLTLNNGAGSSFSGAIGGANGSLVLTTGTQTLTGANTYGGSTTVGSGASLVLTGVGTVHDSSYVTDNGTLDISGGSNANSKKIASLAGASTGVVTLGGNTLTISAATGDANSVFAGSIGAIGDTGGLALTAGTQTLSGTNLYAGATTINGGTLALGSGGSIASSSGVAVTAGGALDISNSGGATINALTGAGGVSLGGNTLTVNNGHATNSSFSGVIADGGINNATGGGLTLTGKGTETLSGVNTYTGATSIGNTSTLALSGSGSIANSSGVADLNVFDISGVSNVANTASIESLSSTAGHAGVVNLGTNTLVLTNAADNFHGAINGSGGLTVNGGSETLSGASTYTGATTIGSGGTLSFTAAGSNSTTDVNDSGGLTLNSQTLQSLTINSGASTVGIGSSTITLTNGGVVNSSIDGQLGIGAAGKLVLTGGTTTIMGGGSFYDTGGLTVQSSAALVLDGLSRSTVTVNSGGQLSGTGVIGTSIRDPDLINSGTVTPGDAILNVGGGNTLFVNGAFTNNSAGTLQINVAAITAPVGPAIAGQAYGTYGNLTVTGLATLGGTLDLNPYGGFNFSNLTGAGVTIYDVLSFGSYADDFSGLDYNGTACTLESKDLYVCGGQITIAEDFTTDPGQLNLDITPVPEPSSWAMLGSALVGLLGFGLLRRRSI